jgi:hypothetical protein
MDHYRSGGDIPCAYGAKVAAIGEAHHDVRYWDATDDITYNDDEYDVGYHRVSA